MTNEEWDLKWYAAGPFKINNVMLVIHATEPVHAFHDALRNKMAVAFGEGAAAAIRSDGVPLWVHFKPEEEIPHGTDIPREDKQEPT